MTPTSIPIPGNSSYGTVVSLERDAFKQILSRAEAPLVVRASAGWRGRKFVYLTAYKGLAFSCKTDRAIDAAGVEWVDAKHIWLPEG